MQIKIIHVKVDVFNGLSIKRKNDFTIKEVTVHLKMIGELVISI